MSTSSFSPESIYCFRLITSWYEDRFKEDINVKFQDHDINPIIDVLIEREMKNVTQIKPLSRIDFHSALRELTEKENLSLDHCEELLDRTALSEIKEWKKVVQAELRQSVPEFIKQLSTEPKTFSEKNKVFYDDLYNFVEELIRWGYYSGDSKDHTFVALMMHDLLTKLEDSYNNDRKYFMEEPLWENNLKLVIKFLENLHPLGIDYGNYIKLVAGVLFYFSNSSQSHVNFESLELKQHIKKNQKTYWREYFLVNILYKPLEKIASEKSIKFVLRTKDFHDQILEKKITRNEWVWKLYNTLVEIKNIEFTARGIQHKLHKFKDSSSVKSIASRFKKREVVLPKIAKYIFLDSDK